MAFVFKVMTLAIRTASKPLANRFQNYVLTHPTLRPAVLRFAQVFLPRISSPLYRLSSILKAGCTQQ